MLSLVVVSLLRVGKRSDSFVQYNSYLPPGWKVRVEFRSTITMFNANNTNTNSPRRRLIKHRPAILGLPDRTSTSVSSNSYSSDNENNGTSIETNTSIRRVYNTTHTDTNTNQRRGGSSTSSRFLPMLGMFAMLIIFLLSFVTPVGYTSNPPIQVLNKSTGDSSTSTSTGVSIHITNAHDRLLNSNRGILPREAKGYVPRIIPASKRKVKDSDDDKKSILYMVQCDLPDKFMKKIKKRCYPLWYRLELTKIGHSQDWDHFQQKMRNLQIHIPFCRLRYIAIEHHHLPSEAAEKAMHYVYMGYHVNGEWYYMNGMSKMYLMSKFPGSNIYMGYTTRPGRGGWTHEEGQGHVYLAKFDWDTRVLPTCRLGALQTIRGILDDPTEPVEHKHITEDMLTTKTGSTIGIRARLSQYTYAQVFANITYHAIPSLNIRYDESALQRDWDAYWKVGEWYALHYPEHWYQIGNATYSLVIHPNIEFLHGVWHRTLESRRIFRHDLISWQNMGLVSDADIVYKDWLIVLQVCHIENRLGYSKSRMRLNGSLCESSTSSKHNISNKSASPFSALFTGSPFVPFTSSSLNNSADI